MAESLEQLLFPDPTRRSHLLSRILAALQAEAGVHSVALFGSLADKRADRWSDIDMIIACDNVEIRKWAAAWALREAIPVLFYQTFSLADQPSGRYWFVGESPFHKLDVSFVSLPEYQRTVHEGTMQGHAIVLREIYSSPSGALNLVTEPALPGILHFDKLETRICR